MKCSRFTENQIIGILKEHEADVSVADLCRKHGVSDATVYKWKAKYGGRDHLGAGRTIPLMVRPAAKRQSAKNGKTQARNLAHA
jgi:putative transposase